MSAHTMLMEAPKSKLSDIDGRVKLVLTFVALFAALSAKVWILPVVFGCLSLVILLYAGVPRSRIRRHLIPVFYVSILTGITQIFLSGHTLWFQWDFIFFRLTGYSDGAVQGALLASRVFGGMSIMLFLTLSTPVQEWVNALSWFKVPLSIIEVMTLGYSSLFILFEELERLQKAQRMRLGYRTWRRRVWAVASVGGILFIRVFDKSQRLWQAMTCRGYNGSSIQVVYQRKFTRQDRMLSSFGLIFIVVTWLELGHY
ncbi:MAG: cobalt ECF transporter T component CbiQ [Desulfitobacteriaceae bacterium]|nr:cobalt ECF transporter T component CbiQ [Desulfitobacteriaceae bacterium]MDI6914735.1 cobalt ECF transporter T component CbiQ [Desulfitobacteriaceae bacterium]